MHYARGCARDCTPGESQCWTRFQRKSTALFASPDPASHYASGHIVSSFCRRRRTVGPHITVLWCGARCFGSLPLCCKLTATALPSSRPSVCGPGSSSAARSCPRRRARALHAGGPRPRRRPPRVCCLASRHSGALVGRGDHAVIWNAPPVAASGRG